MREVREQALEVLAGSEQAAHPRPRPQRSGARIRLMDRRVIGIVETDRQGTAIGQLLGEAVGGRRITLEAQT